jgi:hypothetical protein
LVGAESTRERQVPDQGGSDEVDELWSLGGLRGSYKSDRREGKAECQGRDTDPPQHDLAAMLCPICFKGYHSCGGKPGECLSLGEAHTLPDQSSWLWHVMKASNGISAHGLRKEIA